MTRTPSENDPADPAHSADPDKAVAARANEPTRRKRRSARVAGLSVLSIVVLLGATVATNLAVASNRADSIGRIAVARLLSMTGPPAKSGNGETVLITGADFGPTGAVPPGSKAPAFSGLIMLLHLNANNQAGGLVSLPSKAVVPVPGHGSMPGSTSSTYRR
jgi:hypothetical protein